MHEKLLDLIMLMQNFTCIFRRRSCSRRKAKQTQRCFSSNDSSEFLQLLQFEPCRKNFLTLLLFNLNTMNKPCRLPTRNEADEIFCLRWRQIYFLNFE